MGLIVFYGQYVELGLELKIKKKRKGKNLGSKRILISVILPDMPCMQAEEILQICPPEGSQTGEIDTTGCHEGSYFICIGCDSSAAVCSP